MDYNGFPKIDTINFTLKDGHPVTRDPAISSPADFEFTAPGYGKLCVQQNHTTAKFDIGKSPSFDRLNRLMGINGINNVSLIVWYTVSIGGLKRV